MRSLVVYYSYSGKTKKIAKALTELLSQKGSAEELELIALDEAKSFLGQCQRAFRHKRAKIREVNFDLSNYDLICLGTPIWAFGPAPALNTYIENVLGLSDKNIVLFSTYGSGAGRKRCLNYMEKYLSAKGASSFRRFSIQQSRVEDKEFITTEIKKIFKDGN